MGDLYHILNVNPWLGQPATGQNVLPGTKGLAPTSSSGFPCRIFVEYLEINNRTGGSAGVGLVGLLPDSMWVAGQWTNGTTTYTADTTDAQDADTNDFALETTTQNDGCVFGASVPFGAISVDCTTAGSGTSPTHVLEYWNGSAWTGVTTGFCLDIPRSADWAAGERLILFSPPLDWAVGGTGTNMPATTYNLRIRRTNATQTTAALARRIYLGQVFLSGAGVASNGFYQPPFSSKTTFVIPPYIAGLSVAGAQSNMTAGTALTLIYKFVP